MRLAQILQGCKDFFLHFHHLVSDNMCGDLVEDMCGGTIASTDWRV